MKFSIFTGEKNLYILHGHVFVMLSCLFPQKKEFMEKKLKHQYVPTDLEELEEYQTKKEVKELPHHTVTITDISEVDLAGQGGLRLGRNQVGYYMIFRIINMNFSLDVS